MLTDEQKQRLKDLHKKGNPLEADSFFNGLNIEGRLGRFWSTDTGDPIEPYERLKKYEILLGEIYDWNKEIYTFIHKGTPFYFCGIHSFDIGAYDRAIFYFDAAFSEDIKNKPEKDAFHWTNSAAFAFYRLDTNYGNEIVKVPTGKIRRLIEPLIKEFRANLEISFDLNSLISKFVVEKIKIAEHRSIVPALFLYIVESEQRLLQLKIRSDMGGTIEPFVLHILKGCLIFESLLKLTYSSRNSSNLGDILNDSFIKNDLEFCKNSKTTNKDLIGHIAGVRNTLQDIIIHLIPYIEKQAYISDQWITLTYALRNVTAHNLLWPDRFNLENYEKLYKSVLFSTLYLIYKKF